MTVAPVLPRDSSVSLIESQALSHQFHLPQIGWWDVLIFGRGFLSWKNGDILPPIRGETRKTGKTPAAAAFGPSPAVAARLLFLPLQWLQRLLFLPCCCCCWPIPIKAISKFCSFLSFLCRCFWTATDWPALPIRPVPRVDVEEVPLSIFIGSLGSLHWCFHACSLDCLLNLRVFWLFFGTGLGCLLNLLVFWLLFGTCSLDFLLLNVLTFLLGAWRQVILIILRGGNRRLIVPSFDGMGNKMFETVHFFVYGPLFKTSISPSKVRSLSLNFKPNEQ